MNRIRVGGTTSTSIDAPVFRNAVARRTTESCRLTSQRETGIRSLQSDSRKDLFATTVTITIMSSRRHG